MCLIKGDSFRAFQHIDNRFGVLRYGSNVSTNGDLAIASRVFQVSHGTQ